MKRGRPFEPGNKFGRGRPPGSLNKKTLLARKIFEENSPAIIAAAISKARDDRQMLRMLASQIVTRQRDKPIRIGKLPLKTLEDVDRASETVVDRALSGKISLSEAQQGMELIESRRRIVVEREFERRLQAMENIVGASHPNSLHRT